jgi:hypothetical protein
MPLAIAQSALGRISRFHWCTNVFRTLLEAGTLGGQASLASGQAWLGSTGGAFDVRFNALERLYMDAPSLARLLFA